MDMSFQDHPDDSSLGLKSERYLARYGDDSVITDEFMLAVLEGVGRHYLTKQLPPLNFQAITVHAYVGDGRRNLALLDQMNVWKACVRLRDFRGLLTWDHRDQQHRMLTVRLTPAGFAALGIRQRGKLAQYVREEQ